jgi:hypothetical protein
VTKEGVGPSFRRKPLRKLHFSGTNFDKFETVPFPLTILRVQSSSPCCPKNCWIASKMLEELGRQRAVQSSSRRRKAPSILSLATSLEFE